MLLAAFSAMQVLIIAQGEPEPVGAMAAAVTTDTFQMFEPGDNLLSLFAGASFGLGFLDPLTSTLQAPNLKPGLEIGLSFLYFLSNSWAVGGELSGIFFTSIADRSFFLMPIAAKAIYAIALDPFYITPSISLGVAISALNETNHVDPYVGIGSGFSWRPNSEVSYSIKLGLSAVPQFYTDSSQNRVGFFLDTLISATYHL